jgi:hypothetical protein
MPDTTDIIIKPPTTAEICPFATAVWSAFITKFRSNIREGAIAPHYVDEWATGVRAPYVNAWERLCKNLSLPFPELLLIIASFDVAEDDQNDRRAEMKWRRTTLRSFYGRVHQKYYPILDRLLSRKIDVSLSSGEHVDIRDHVKELDELRRFKWAKLVTPLKKSISTKRPDNVAKHISHEDWISYITGKSYPSVAKAGLVGEALGLAYDDVFEAYQYDELVSDLNFTHTYRNTVNCLRVRFNKGWSAEVRNSATRQSAVASRKRQSRAEFLQKRNKLLIEAFESAVRRSLDLTEAGDLAGAGMAKVEAQSLNSAMVSMGVSHSTAGFEDAVVSSTRPKAAKDGYMRLNPSTGRMERVSSKARVEPIPYKHDDEDDEDDADDVDNSPIEPIPWPPPPPPPPPPVPDLLENFEAPRQVVPDDVPPSISAVMDL